MKLVIVMCIGLLSGIISWHIGFSAFQITVVVLLILNLFNAPDLTVLGQFIEDKFLDIEDKLEDLQNSIDNMESSNRTSWSE